MGQSPAQEVAKALVVTETVFELVVGMFLRIRSDLEIKRTLMSPKEQDAAR